MIETLGGWGKQSGGWGVTKAFRKALSKGREEGIQEGIQEGVEKGREEGIQKGIEKVAANLLQDGMDSEKVVELTNLSRSRVESLWQKMNGGSKP